MFTLVVRDLQWMMCSVLLPVSIFEVPYFIRNPPLRIRFWNWWKEREKKKLSCAKRLYQCLCYHAYISAKPVKGSKYPWETVTTQKPFCCHQMILVYQSSLFTHRHRRRFSFPLYVLSQIAFCMHLPYYPSPFLSTSGSIRGCLQDEHIGSME